MAVINQVTSRDDIAGGAVLVFAGEFDSKVHVMNDVALDEHSGAAVHVDSAGRLVNRVLQRLFS